MGTTLHAHIEVKKGNKWLHFAAPSVRPCYILFAAINGERKDDFRPSVRENIVPQASMNSLPNDMSEVTKICYEQDKSAYHLHGECVLSADDLLRLQNHLQELNPYDSPMKWDLEDNIFCTYIGGNAIARHDGWDDARIICWYDN